ncbi:MAG: PilZ domain-containing protein [Proteobacteria bacterium]|nr:PilZ domain-containing protein [Pseudomonadota bacterium]
MVAPLRRILLGLKSLATGRSDSPLEGRRDFARAAVDAKVTIFFENRTFDGRLRDVSISGAMLEPDCGMRIGADLELELPSISGRVQARVIHLSVNGVGVRFTNPSIGVLIAGWSRGTSAMSVVPASGGSHG